MHFCQLQVFANWVLSKLVPKNSYKKTVLQKDKELSNNWQKYFSKYCISLLLLYRMHWGLNYSQGLSNALLLQQNLSIVWRTPFFICLPTSIGWIHGIATVQKERHMWSPSWLVLFNYSVKKEHCQTSQYFIFIVICRIGGGGGGIMRSANLLNPMFTKTLRVSSAMRIARPSRAC